MTNGLSAQKVDHEVDELRQKFKSATVRFLVLSSTCIRNAGRHRMTAVGGALHGAGGEYDLKGRRQSDDHTRTAEAGGRRNKAGPVGSGPLCPQSSPPQSVVSDRWLVCSQQWTPTQMARYRGKVSTNMFSTTYNAMCQLFRVCARDF